MKMQTNLLLKAALLGILILSINIVSAQEDGPWLHFHPPADLSNGKYIVLVAGDEAYRSEESLPMLAKILAQRHGFRTTVLFSINPETNFIDPDYHQNIPGLQFLDSADLMVIATRFRELPDDQMKHIVGFIDAGKPVLGLRTATHAFHYTRNPENQYAKYGFISKEKGWEGGFGKRVLGETWVSHHGANGKEGSRGLLDGIALGNGHPILRGVKDIWVITDVYGIKSLPSDAEVLVWGQPTAGLTEDSPGLWEKSIMPVAWTQTYTAESGKKGKSFTTTMGASKDFINEDLRRLVVNAAYWATDLEQMIPEKSNVDFVGGYDPTMFGFGEYIKQTRPDFFK
jgi:type 1 glutamine amidotransferase